ncbi:MAG: AraC family transcriptional regulator [Kiritimatiellae bacterium]|nr:AraC family transcriptional regulator [Kiritimatiellia bacterium]
MSTQFRYFAQDKASMGWGLCVYDVGWQRVSPHDDYPMKQHPDGYYYTWETGRRLSEYQLCFVFSGDGVVEFEPNRPVALSQGNLLLLAPGEWHRCRPDPETGWGTLWIGFGGKMARSIVRRVFHQDGSFVLPVAKANEFESSAMRLVNQMLKFGERRLLSSAGDLMSLLGRIAEEDFDSEAVVTTSGAIREAQSEIIRRACETIDLMELAKSVGMTYDSFRHQFADMTGFSPLQFQLTERMRVAKNLVANTNLSISDIARRTGFSSAAYFARSFKAATKLSPVGYRRTSPSLFQSVNP